MKTSLDHLPASTREALSAIAELVQRGATVEWVILFGSYARGDWVDDRETGYRSDFDLLLVVATPAQAEDHSLWSRLSEEARAIAGQVPVTFIVHDVKQVNQEIRKGQYFFVDIVREGVVLYTSRRFDLAKPKVLTVRERLDLGRSNFRYWFESASEFFRLAGHCAARGLGPHAAFLLHQAAERYFHAALLVFTGYKPRLHDLKQLAEQAAPLHPMLAGALPRSEGEDERLFDLLKRAYIDARYSKSYRVTSEELAGMRAMVLDLAERVRVTCLEKLTSFCGAEAVGTLSEVPSISDRGELPETPPLEDPKALAMWREALAALSFEQGQQRGREQGLREGEERGQQRGREQGLREGQAQAIVEVLRRRGVVLLEEEAERILSCRDEAELARLWERAWSVEAVAELWGE